MSKAVKGVLWVLGTIVVGAIASMVATAAFDLRLPRWLLREPVQVPAEQPALETNWLMIWLVVIAIVAGVALALLLAVSREPRERPEPTEFDYKKDSFFGLVWRWSFGGEQIRNLACFCRICDRQCQLQEIGRWPFDYAVNCNVHGEQHRFTGELETLLNDARIEIQRKLRNGEWKHVVERDRPARNLETKS